MEIELYKFSKRINSTKRPVAGSGLTANCTIKQNAPYVGTFGSSSDTTVCYPVLFLQGVKDPNAYNYCKTFNGRYYFIRDIQIDIDGAATLHCEIDVLATRKNEILASRQYVIYSASMYNNKIADARLPLENDIIVDYDFQVPTVPEFDMYSPTYIVTALSQKNSLSTVYAMTGNTMRAIAQLLANPSQQTILDQLKIYLRAPADAIMSIYVTPYNLYRDGDTEFQLGHLTAVGSRTRILNPDNDVSPTRIMNLVLSLDAPNELDYTYSDEYSKYLIRIPYCDDLIISGDRLIDSGSLSVVLNIYLDHITGDVYAVAETNETPSATKSKILGWTSGNVYFELPWGTVGSFAAPALVNAFKTIASQIGIGGGISTSFNDATSINTIGGKIQPNFRQVNTGTSYNGGANFGVSGLDIVNAFEAGYQNARGQARCQTGGHGFCEGYITNGAIYLYRFHNKIAWNGIEEVKEFNGLPLNRVVTLGSLSGFCQCKNPSIVIDDLKLIAELINGYLSSGFFIE